MAVGGVNRWRYLGDNTGALRLANPNYVGNYHSRIAGHIDPDQAQHIPRDNPTNNITETHTRTIQIIRMIRSRAGIKALALTTSPRQRADEPQSITDSPSIQNTKTRRIHHAPESGRNGQRITESQGTRLDYDIADDPASNIPHDSIPQWFINRRNGPAQRRARTMTSSDVSALRGWWLRHIDVTTLR